MKKYRFQLMLIVKTAMDLIFKLRVNFSGRFYFENVLFYIEYISENVRLLVCVRYKSIYSSLEMFKEVH